MVETVNNTLLYFIRQCVYNREEELVGAGYVCDNYAGITDADNPAVYSRLVAGLRIPV